MIREIRMEKPATRKNWNRDHVDATRTRDQVGGHGHFAYFEFLKFELAPKSFGGMGIGRDQFDPFGFNCSVHKRLDSLVERGDKAQSQFCHRFSFIWSSSRPKSFSSGFRFLVLTKDSVYRWFSQRGLTNQACLQQTTPQPSSSAG